MSSKKYKPRPISGFPEWSPAVRAVEVKWLDIVRRIFESHGFSSIETPSVEELPVLLAKGETDKEIYALTRFSDKGTKNARLGLHFDLTVPFSRYVAQHLSELTFPFKRYQLQRVWRGERPQDGRFREFYQCDIDVIDRDHVSYQFDIELPMIIRETLDALAIGPYTIKLANRKILQGFYEALGVEDFTSAVRIADKMDKIGPDGVASLLSSELNLSEKVISKCLDLAKIRSQGPGFADEVAALKVNSNLLEEGLEELQVTITNLTKDSKRAYEVDLSIARGFDYYTGIVYEGVLDKFPDYGSICSGGRYANLAGTFCNQNLPGIGLSIGLTRIFYKLLKVGGLEHVRPYPTDLLITLANDSQRDEARELGRRLRDRGYAVEVYHDPVKLGKQLKYAAQKEIPFVWFLPQPMREAHRVKNMNSGEQRETDPNKWVPEDF